MDRIFSARIDEAALDQLERTAGRLGWTKKRLLEEAIERYARDLNEDAATDIWTETSGAWQRREAPERTVAAIRKTMRRSFKRHHGVAGRR
jgi:hypothetical protein